MIIAGGLTDGSNIVKSLCLGADGVAMGRAFIIASEARLGPSAKPVRKLKDSVGGIVNFVEATKVEVQMLASALDVYKLNQLSKESITALDKTVADILKIWYIYS
jgi:NAD(P)H-dependent flavin oxidoreductase YrpB (nitropropane dioxygenase family)